MNGDGMGGLAIAIAILLACVLLFVAPALVLFFVAKAFTKGSRHGFAIALGAATIGFALSAVAVAATFFRIEFRANKSIAFADIARDETPVDRAA